MRLIISVGPSQPAYISLAPDDLLCLLSTFFMSLQIMIVSVESRHRIISEFLNNKMRPATLAAALSASHLLYSDVCEAICTPMSIPGLVPRWSVVMSVPGSQYSQYSRCQHLSSPECHRSAPPEDTRSVNSRAVLLPRPGPLMRFPD